MPLRTEKQARVSKCINPLMTKSAEPYRAANKLHVHGAGEASTEPDSLVPEDKPGTGIVYSLLQVLLYEIWTMLVSCSTPFRKIKKRSGHKSACLDIF